MRTALVTTTVLSGILLLACAKTVVDQVPTSEENGTDPAGSSGKTSTGKDAGASSSSSSSSSGGAGKDAGKKTPPADDPGNDPGTGGGQCASEATFDTCIDCCVTAHPDGSDTFYGSYINCLCTSACATQCAASLCDTANPTSPDAACDACITNNGNACQNDVATACSADPDCIAFDSCVGDSSCSTKP